MRSRDKESTRRRILDAAMDVFSEKGYTNALIDDIAKESDTSKGAFYFHFPSKKAIFEALLQTLVQRIVRDVEETIDSRQGAVDKIEGALHTVLGTLSRHEKATRLLFVEATGLGKIFDQHVLAAHRQFAALIAKHLQTAVDDRSIAPIDVDLTAYAWLGAIHEVLLMALLGPEKRSLESLTDPLCALLVSSLRRPDTLPANPSAALDVPGAVGGSETP
ncbi:MAG: TetR/AcrR family transcriptional regulator [Bacilli bacterium]